MARNGIVEDHGDWLLIYVADKTMKIDRDVYDRIENRIWLGSTGYPEFACTKTGRHIKVHRFACEGKVVDHRKGDKLDARRSMLRSTIQSMNLRNKALVTARGYTGVYKEGNRWTARVIAEDVTNKGGFTNPLLAASWRVNKLQELGYTIER